MKLPYIDLKEDRAEPIGSAIRVLVVDDFEPFRRFVCSRLGEESTLHVVGEDGLDAVCRAEELQPDLIILDIGLPKLNGIEAARRIRQLSSSSKILFLKPTRTPQSCKQH